MIKLQMRKEKTTQKKAAYEKIKNYILESGIKPGSPIDEQTLTEITGTSRTPVREALLQLSIEGLIEIIPKKGAFITRISLQDIIEIFQLREVVEGYAARLAASKINPDKLDEINNLFIIAKKEKNPSKKIEMHMKSNELLHSYILECCGNSRFQKIDNSYNNLVKLEINLTNSMKGIVEKSYLEHMAIIKALKSGNPDEAEKAMRKHIFSVFNNIMEIIQ